MVKDVASKLSMVSNIRDKDLISASNIYVVDGVVLKYRVHSHPDNVIDSLLTILNSSDILTDMGYLYMYLYNIPNVVIQTGMDVRLFNFSDEKLQVLNRGRTPVRMGVTYTNEYNNLVTKF